MLTTDVNSTLEKWSKTIEKLSKAIAEKNYNLFKISYSEGCRCFQVISEFVNQNDISDELREKILTVSQAWSNCSNSLNNWKNETAFELSQLKKSNAARGKLTNAYAFKNAQIGINLRRKAH